jgi:ABC-type dipeptide/oligopeptide/nickel transport system ATPase component
MSLPPGALAADVPLVLDATAVQVSFGKGAQCREVIHGVGLGVRQGEVTAIVGESGSGKTVFTRTISGQHVRGSQTGGTAVFDGIDLMSAPRSQLQTVLGNRIGCVPQDPTAALDPMRRVGSQLVETMMQHRRFPARRQAKAHALELLELVGIHDPQRVFGCYPHQLSGGMRQRIAISIAVCCEPELIVADEPSSALDASVGVRIVELLGDLRDRLGTAILLITHDIGIAARIADSELDRVAVMLQGQIVELGSARAVLGNPAHPYTQALIHAEPSAQVPRGQLATVPDEVRGCTDWGPLQEVAPGHAVRVSREGDAP